MPVRFEPSIAGNVPVMFAAGILVRFAADDAGKVAGKAVKLAPLIAGKAPVSCDAAMLLFVKVWVAEVPTISWSLPAGNVKAFVTPAECGCAFTI